MSQIHVFCEIKKKLANVFFLSGLFVLLLKTKCCRFGRALNCKVVSSKPVMRENCFKFKK